MDSPLLKTGSYVWVISINQRGKLIFLSDDGVICAVQLKAFTYHCCNWDVKTIIPINMPKYMKEPK